MARKRHSREEVVQILGQVDAELATGLDIDAVCEKLGVSKPTIKRWQKERDNNKPKASWTRTSKKNDRVELEREVVELGRQNALLRKIMVDMLLEQAGTK